MSRTSTNSQNRSDYVRQRRSTRSSARIERAARTVSAPKRVTVRGEGFGQPVIQRAASRPRRVYPINVHGTTGRAVFIPAPSISLNSRMLSGLLVVGLIAVFFFIFNAEQFEVIRPTIVGASRVSVNDVEAVLNVNGESIFAIDPYQELKELTQAFPEIKGASIQVGLPNIVTLRFEERQPILAWAQKNQTRWIDAEGTIFAARGETPSGLLTVVSDNDPPLRKVVPTPGPTSTISPTPEKSGQVLPTPEPAVQKFDLLILSQALTLSTHLPEKATLVYAEDGGLGWRDSRGWDVFFGTTLDDLQQKISMYEAIVSQLSQKGIKPKYINIVNLHAPYYRLER